jgi:hypothetical protein
MLLRTANICQGVKNVRFNMIGTNGTRKGVKAIIPMVYQAGRVMGDFILFYFLKIAYIHCEKQKC